MISFLCYNIPQREDMKDCIIIFSENAHLSGIINGIKGKMLLNFEKILSFIHETIPNQEWNKSKFFQYIPQLKDLLLKSFERITLVAGQNVQDIFANDTVHSIYVYCLKILTTCEQFECHVEAADKSQAFFINILLPLIKTSKKELDDFQNNPDEFVALAIDTCEKQFSKIFKTSAAHHFEILSEHVDGFLTFAAKFCVEAIDFSFKCNDLNELSESNYPLLFEHKGSNFVSFFPLESRIEAAFVILSVASYLISKRIDLEKLLVKL